MLPVGMRRKLSLWHLRGAYAPARDCGGFEVGRGEQVVKMPHHRYFLHASNE